jgi:hypothetical protein
MAISWLSALKVVPWDKVLEHAPGVLEKARGFIDKHRTGRVDAPTELVQLAQQQMAQALAELAEQNAALIAAVRRLQVRLQFTNSNFYGSFSATRSFINACILAFTAPSFANFSRVEPIKASDIDAV